MAAKAVELWAQPSGPGSVAEARIQQRLEEVDPSGWTVERAGPLFPKEESGKA